MVKGNSAGMAIGLMERWRPYFCTLRLGGWSALLLATFAFSPSAYAAPSLAGNTGLIKTPTAYVFSDGEFIIGFSWVGGARSYLFRPLTNRMYFASIGVLPGLELSLDMLQVIGWVDPDAPGVAWAIHRLSNAKYRLPLPANWPKVAFGAQDPLSANFFARGPVGKTSYGLTTYYGVVSHSIGPVSGHFGLAQSRDFLNGVFGGADIDLGHGLNYRVEYDSQQWNVGLLWSPFGGLGVHIARLFPDEWAYGLFMSWKL